jgi:DNA-directed RNA polymerase subunit RPC12/RpoP
MSPKRPGLVVFYSGEGKPLKARCSACGANVRRRKVTTEGNDTEVFCPSCQSSLLVVNDISELKRILARGAAIISRAPKRSR